MRRAWLAMLLLAAACGSVDAEGPVEIRTDVSRAEPVAGAPSAELSAGFAQAGFGLWRSQAGDENFVFSPVSIGHALLMARAAADATTGSAIDAAFRLPAGPLAHDAWNAVDHAVGESAAAQEDVVVTMADRIWPRIDLEPNQEWIDLLASHHGATTEKLDFDGDPAASRDIINDWVAEQTQDLIPELLPDGFIKPGQTVLVLTDAIYFKAPWATQFGKYQTVTDTFTRLDGSTVGVEFMRELELSDRRGEGDGFSAAEIPYAGGDFSMLLIVPDEGRFEEVRDRLGADLLDEIETTFTTGPYELLMPGWETTTHLDLLAWLEGIGASPGSYPAISPDAYLAAAVHAADITVDEWGTVAAAATGVGFDESAAAEPDLTIRADHPFLYLIRHRPSGMVLFAGQVTDPGA